MYGNGLLSGGGPSDMSHCRNFRCGSAGNGRRSGARCRGCRRDRRPADWYHLRSRGCSLSGRSDLRWLLDHRQWCLARNRRYASCCYWASTRNITDTNFATIVSGRHRSWWNRVIQQVWIRGWWVRRYRYGCWLWHRLWGSRLSSRRLRWRHLPGQGFRIEVWLRTCGTWIQIHRHITRRRHKVRIPGYRSRNW